MESPCECGIGLPGSLSHGVNKVSFLEYIFSTLHLIVTNLILHDNNDWDLILIMQLSREFELSSLAPDLCSEFSDR